jgi:hypothetical protein
VYTESGVYTYQTTNAAGCDSTATLNLTVNYSTAGVETVTACNSYVWHGVEYFASVDTVTYTTVNAAGCDSVVTLNLTVNQCNTTELVACDSYTWNVTGLTYTEGGTYVSGTDTLLLTINHSTAAVDQQEACDSYTWIDGNIYNESNSTATFTLENVAGCDSVVTLDLTVNYTVYNSVVLTAAQSYTVNNHYITESTVFTDTLTALTGCDSIVTYDITIVDTIWYNVNVISDSARGSVTGAGRYEDGALATLTATAADGYRFLAWSDGQSFVSMENPYSFTVTEDVTLTALFRRDFVPDFIDSITFNLAVNDSAMGTTTPAPGIYRYAAGDLATVTAAANEGYHLDYWLVSALGLTDTLREESYSGVLPTNLAGLSISVTAVFAADPVVHTTYNIIGESNDTTMGIVIGSGPYEEGTIATLTAMAKPGHRFVQWSNGETTATIQIYVTEDVTLIATFEPVEGIDDVEIADVEIYAVGRDIFVNGANGRDIYVFDVNGRLIVSQKSAGETAAFRMRDTGVYLVKVGTASAKRVMVMR